MFGIRLSTLRSRQRALLDGIGRASSCTAIYGVGLVVISLASCSSEDSAGSVTVSPGSGGTTTNGGSGGAGDTDSGDGKDAGTGGNIADTPLGTFCYMIDGAETCVPTSDLHVSRTVESGNVVFSVESPGFNVTGSIPEGANLPRLANPGEVEGQDLLIKGNCAIRVETITRQAEHGPIISCDCICSDSTYDYGNCDHLAPLPICGYREEPSTCKAKVPEFALTIIMLTPDEIVAQFQGALAYYGVRNDGTTNCFEASWCDTDSGWLETYLDECYWDYPLRVCSMCQQQLHPDPASSYDGRFTQANPTAKVEGVIHLAF